MEYEEIKALWEQYDNKLNNLEKLNKKLIRETLSRKPQRKINYHKFQSYYALIAVPVILIIALQGNFTIANYSWKLILGSILILSVILYVSYLNLKAISILKGIDLLQNSIIESLSKMIEFKLHHQNRSKSSIYYYPVIFAGVLLIGWNGFLFDEKTIIYLTIFFIITYAINIIAPKRYARKIGKLAKEIEELKEYEN